MRQAPYSAGRSWLFGGLQLCCPGFVGGDQLHHLTGEGIVGDESSKLPKTRRPFTEVTHVEALNRLPQVPYYFSAGRPTGTGFDQR